jgi:hypothetical protein
VIKIESQFLMFKIADDPTGQDLKLWNDLSHLIRFGEAPRKIVNQLLSCITRPFYGVHFRVESDAIWSSLDHQLSVDLDALDRAWAQYGTPDVQKPLVYLACGDQQQVEKFVSAGRARGWEVTHKWHLTQSHVLHPVAQFGRLANRPSPHHSISQKFPIGHTIDQFEDILALV